MAGTQIVCPIFTVNLGDARSDNMGERVGLWNQCRLLSGHLLYFFFRFITLNYFLQVICIDIDDKKYTYNVLY